MGYLERQHGTGSDYSWTGAPTLLIIKSRFTDTLNQLNRDSMITAMTEGSGVGRSEENSRGVRRCA
jgi:hypothetical protein